MLRCIDVVTLVVEQATYMFSITQFGFHFQASNLDALIIPGGFAPDYWRRDERILQLVRDMDGAGKILASICHGPWVLISAKVVKGRNVTCFVAIKDDVENAGANYTDTSVVIDRNMVTSRIPKDLPDFCKAIISILK